MDRTLTSRVERKYLISPYVADQIRHWILPYMQHDPFSAKAEGSRYQICSLYLDSEELYLYNQTKNSEKNRFKLRIRTYADNDCDPLFFEIKKRINQVVRKERASVARKEGEGILDAPVKQIPCDSNSESAAISNFINLTKKTLARPQVRVRYMREAFESRSFDPVRITFDTELSTSTSPKAELDSSTGHWVSVPNKGTILEVKNTGSPPVWIQTMMEIFELTNQSVPKYILCVDQTPHLSQKIRYQYGNA